MNIDFIEIQNSDIKYQMIDTETNEVLKSYYQGDLPIHFSREREEMEKFLEGKNIELKFAQNTVETLELISALNALQRLEQAQASAELIELMMMMLGGI